MNWSEEELNDILTKNPAVTVEGATEMLSKHNESKKETKMNNNKRIPMTEEVLQQQIIDYAHLQGWFIAHFRTARTQRPNGTVYYQTPVQADGKGFPDLVMVRGLRVLFVECKSETGKLSIEQQVWRDLLRTAQEEYYLWRPSNWDELVEILK